MFHLPKCLCRHYFLHCTIVYVGLHSYNLALWPMELDLVSERLGPPFLFDILNTQCEQIKGIRFSCYIQDHVFNGMSFLSFTFWGHRVGA